MPREVKWPHPGEILLHEFLEPMQITQYRLAKAIAVPQRRISEIISGTRSITVDTGLRLSKFFGMSDGFWTGLQQDHDRVMAKERMESVLAQIMAYQPKETHA